MRIPRVMLVLRNTASLAFWLNCADKKLTASHSKSVALAIKKLLLEVPDAEFDHTVTAKSPSVIAVSKSRATEMRDMRLPLTLEIRRR